MTISISDNGMGFNELTEGFGLLGMRERVEKVGGKVEIHSRPKEGTRLSVWIPLESKNSGEESASNE